MTTWFWILMAPVLGGVVYGGERVLRARMQRRQGPPLLQPFYDMFKLMDKRTLVIHSAHALLGVVHFFVLWVTVGAIFFGWNLLYIVFLHLFALIVLVLAGYSVRSVYSHVGANRELLALVAYEPVLLLVTVGFYLSAGSFSIDEILRHGPYLLQMPLLFLALLIIVPIKVKKSPFDVVEAHQEIVGGVEVEYSGLFYEFLYMARFLEYLFIYSFVFLFGGAEWWLGALLVAGAFLLVNLVDNATARVRTADMIRISYAVALTLAVVNIIGLLVWNG
jgi:ech hydrogenase subunit B